MTDRIADYFEQKLSPAQKAQFEADLQTDGQLAEDVAFYLASKRAAVFDKPNEDLVARHAEWQSLAKKSPKVAYLRIWYAVAAAVLLAIGISWYWLGRQHADLKEMADGYAMEKFTVLPLQMGGSQDSLQTAIGSYNRGQYATAKKMCARILERDPDNAEAKKIAGIVSLKLLDYDKALDYFRRLGEQKELYSNYGKFYEAIALLKRNGPGDEEKAELLLREVVAKNLEGKKEAEKWLR